MTSISLPHRPDEIEDDRPVNLWWDLAITGVGFTCCSSTGSTVRPVTRGENMATALALPLSFRLYSLIHVTWISKSNQHDVH